MEPDKVKKTSSSSSSNSSPSSWLNDLKNVHHRKGDIAKLYKKVEKVGRRLLHNEGKHHSTFVASSIQPNEQGTSGPPPPYPVNNQFGSAFPPLPTPSQNNNPPTYGWALNSVPSAPGALSLDIGIGDETAGSGFDYLTDQNMYENGDYLRPQLDSLEAKRNEQSTALRILHEKVDSEWKNLNTLMNDDSHLTKYIRDNFGEGALSKKNEDIAVEIGIFSAILQQRRELNPERTPPPRPPPPRSISQDLTSKFWKCTKCETENQNSQYRCRICCLPSRRVDPTESSACKCSNCSN